MDVVLRGQRKEGLHVALDNDWDTRPDGGKPNEQLEVSFVDLLQPAHVGFVLGLSDLLLVLEVGVVREVSRHAGLAVFEHALVKLLVEVGNLRRPVARLAAI